MISVDRFTKGAQEVAQRAAEIMQRYSHNQMDTEHLLLALIEQPQGDISTPGFLKSRRKGALRKAG